jgi:glycerophosphoryl diester phosphodiesterase
LSKRTLLIGAGLLLAALPLGAQQAGNLSWTDEPEQLPDCQIHGHRGARGHLPENTIPGFRKALALGARWLELDIVVTQDRQLLVSHEPWMHSQLCTRPDGRPVADGQAHNIYEMTAREAQRYDCGRRGDPDFPGQKARAAHKPLLGEVVAAVQHYRDSLMLRDTVFYNIEIKAKPAWDGQFTPPPAPYAELVARRIRELGIGDRCMVQSFDHRVLNELHEQAAHLRLGYLSAKPFALMMATKTKLAFRPYAFNPNYRLVNKQLLRRAHRQGIRVVPWTVNDQGRMKELIRLGVDGLISDYPGRVKAALAAVRRERREAATEK